MQNDKTNEDSEVRKIHETWPSRFKIFASGGAVLISLLAGSGSKYIGQWINPVSEPTYETQIQTLNSVVKSINTLKVFVERQKVDLEESQITLSALQDKQDILKPVIEADQKTVDAIFAIQAQKERTSVWVERSIGFFLGIAGSLIASLIWGYFQRWKKEG